MTTPGHDWLSAAPDEPSWVEVRSILLRGQATLLGSPEGGFVVSELPSLAAVIGRPRRDTLDEALQLLAPDADMLVASASLPHIRDLLPSALPRRAIVHTRPGPPDANIDPAVFVARTSPSLLSTLPGELADEVLGSEWVAVSSVDGSAVAVCAAFWPTETLWDVGVDTLPDYRRMGYAGRCFNALDVHMTGLGLSPVWGAYEDNVASLSMAAGLGFEPVDELFVIELASLEPNTTS